MPADPPSRHRLGIGLPIRRTVDPPGAPAPARAPAAGPAQRLEHGADDLGEVAPQHRIRDVQSARCSPRRTRSASPPPVPAACVTTWAMAPAWYSAAESRLGSGRPRQTRVCTARQNETACDTTSGRCTWIRYGIGADDVPDRRQASRRLTGPAARRRARAATASGSTSACRPRSRWACGPPCGCSHARSPAWRGRACPRREGRAGAGSIRLRRPRTTASAVATGWWSAGTGRTHRARRQRLWPAAIRRAACCRCVATPVPDTPNDVIART